MMIDCLENGITKHVVSSGVTKMSSSFSTAEDVVDVFLIIINYFFTSFTLVFLVDSSSKFISTIEAVPFWQRVASDCDVEVEFSIVQRSFRSTSVIREKPHSFTSRNSFQVSVKSRIRCEALGRMDETTCN